MTTSDPNSYLRNAVYQATPEQLQLMLYDAAIRNASHAKEAIGAKDFETSFEKLSRAQAIIMEMQAGLRPEVNAELCDRTSALYNFIYRKLVDACVQRESAPIDDALRILKLERETWAMLVRKITEARAQESPQSTPYSATVDSDAVHAGSLCVEG
jgi:flagellar protein FliS